MEQLEQYKNMLTTGIALAGATEFLLSTAMKSLEGSGVTMRHEAKKASSMLLDAIRKVQIWNERLQLQVLGNDQYTVDIYDNLAFNSIMLAKLSMYYYDIYSSENEDASKDLTDVYCLLQSLSAKSVNGAFTSEFIESFHTPK